MLKRATLVVDLMRRIPALTVLLSAAAASAPAATCSAQEEPATLDVWTHSWEAGADIIQGFAGTGKVFHQDAGEPQKLIEFVLMPAGWTGDDGAIQDPQLYFGTKQLHIGDTSMQLIDLLHGAAYIQLGNLDGEVEDLVLHEVRRVAYSQYLALRPGEQARGGEQPKGGQAVEPREPQEMLRQLSPQELRRSLPAELERFNARILAFADDWRLAAKMAGEAAPDAQTLFSTMPDEVATELFWIYWPIIITRRIVAGAEGTKVVVASLPAADDTGDADAHAFVKLIEIDPAHNAAVTLPNGAVFSLVLDEERRFDIKTGETPVEQEPSDDHKSLLSKLQEMMAAGFTSAFPGGDPP